MTKNTIKFFLMLLALSKLVYCCGQPEQTETDVSEIGKSVSKLSKDIWAIHQDREGGYWFGSNSKGIYHFKGQELKQYTTKDGLINNQVRGIQEDRDGNIYIETAGGISRFNGMKFTRLEVMKSRGSEWKKEAGDLWFKCHCNSNIVYRYDGEQLHELRLPEKDLKLLLDDSDSPSEERRYSPYDVYGIDKDKEGNIWFGTVKAGAFRFDGKSFLWIGEKELSVLPDGRVPGVRSVVQDKDGYFWLSNFHSKYKIDPKLPKGYEKVKATDLSESLIKDKVLYFNSGLSDKKGNLQMITYEGGVWKYDGNTLSNQEIRNGKESLQLLTIYEDRHGTIWLGTRNDGVYKQTENSFQKFEPGKEK